MYKINKESEVRLPGTNPSYSFESILFSSINFISHVFNMAEKNFARQHRRDITLFFSGSNFLSFLCIGFIIDVFRHSIGFSDKRTALNNFRITSGLLFNRHKNHLI